MFEVVNGSEELASRAPKVGERYTAWFDSESGELSTDRTRFAVPIIDSLVVTSYSLFDSI